MRASRTVIGVVAAALAGCGMQGHPAAQTVTVTSTLPPVTQTQTVTYTPPPPPGPKTTITADGTYQVGVDILPGTYRSTGGGDCYWARLRTLATNDIIDNDNASGPAVVAILPSDAAFLTKRCGTWQRSG